MLVAGPCAIQSRKQAFRIARKVKECGGTIFRGGAYKGQNRPIVNGLPAYWGMGDEAVYILADIQQQVQIPCVTEVQSIRQAVVAIDAKLAYLQVGARHMQNFPLLRYLGEHANVPIILKRGLGNTVDEWTGCAEHLGGASRVILCERGISSFDRTQQTRWRLDFVGAAYIKEYTDYPVIMDPSHGSGDRRLVLPLSKAALQMSDGLMVEVHYAPERSKTDAAQTINFKAFEEIAKVYHDGKRKTPHKKRNRDTV